MKSYPEIEDLYIGFGQSGFLPGILEELNRDFTQLLILTDENTSLFCLPRLESVLDAGGLTFHNIKIRAGEAFKTHQTCLQIWNAFHDCKSGRHTLLINLGGGMISDVGGFAASVYNRGLPFLNIPTTLMAQVDAAIGGKTGINFRGVKNQIGSFGFPLRVIIDPAFLESLPRREYISAFPELMKYAVLSDGAKISWLDEDFPGAFPDTPKGMENLADIIRWSVFTKLTLIGDDFREGGNRQLLNLGHTIGHALEAWSHEGSSFPLLHGEAVGAGMICELYISCKFLGFPTDIMEFTAASILKRIAKPELPARLDILEKYMVYDKKSHSGSLRFALVEAPGKGRFGIEVPMGLVKESLDYYQNI